MKQKIRFRMRYVLQVGDRSDYLIQPEGKMSEAAWVQLALMGWPIVGRRVP